MNKYQEALQRLATDYIAQYGNPSSDFETLQELIYNYESSVQMELDRRYRNLIKYLDNHCESWRSDIVNGNQNN